MQIVRSHKFMHNLHSVSIGSSLCIDCFGYVRNIKMFAFGLNRILGNAVGERESARLHSINVLLQRTAPKSCHVYAIDVHLY